MRESSVSKQRPEREKGKSPTARHMKGLEIILDGAILIFFVDCSRIVPLSKDVPFYKLSLFIVKEYYIIK